MVRLAVTGGVACGKTFLGDVLAAAGVLVCDADSLAHDAMAPGGAAYEETVREFGGGILDASGGIDRRILGRRVFSDADRLAALNAIVHPHVRRAWRAWIDAADKRGVAEVCVIVPLLYEVGEGRGWDAVIVVAAPRSVQMARMLERGIDAAEVEPRLKSQWPTERKMALADYVVVNGGSREALRRQADAVLGRIREQAWEARKAES